MNYAKFDRFARFVISVSRDWTEEQHSEPSEAIEDLLGADSDDELAMQEILGQIASGCRLPKLLEWRATVVRPVPQLYTGCAGYVAEG